jgi:glycosyltransferase involved in cell wall biosynthesis
VKVEKNKIWIVSELFYPETISTAYIMSEISESLSKIYDIEVICGSKFYEFKSDFQNHKDFAFKVNRVNTPQYNKNNILTRLLGNLNISWKMFLLMKNKIPENSQILMVSNPIFLIWLTSLLIKKKFWKVKLIVHDVFPENLNSLNGVNSITKAFFPFLKRTFDRAFSKMDTLILLGRDMKDVFSRKVKNGKFQIIENWSEIEKVYPKNIFETKCVFIFAGNFGRVQGIDILLESLSLIRNLEFNFLFIGSGACQNLIKAFIKKNNSNLIQLYPWQPRDKQNDFLNQATIGVVTLAKGMYGLGVPSKFYNLLAAGKPIFYIGPKNSEIWLVIKEYDIGWVAESGNILEIRETLEKIITTEHQLLEKYSNNSRKLAEIKYSKQLILEKYNKLF